MRVVTHLQYHPGETLKVYQHQALAFIGVYSETVILSVDGPFR